MTRIYIISRSWVIEERQLIFLEGSARRGSLVSKSVVFYMIDQVLPAIWLRKGPFFPHQKLAKPSATRRNAVPNTL